MVGVVTVSVPAVRREGLLADLRGRALEISDEEEAIKVVIPTTNPREAHEQEEQLWQIVSGYGATTSSCDELRQIGEDYRTAEKIVRRVSLQEQFSPDGIRQGAVRVALRNQGLEDYLP